MMLKKALVAAKEKVDQSYVNDSELAHVLRQVKMSSTGESIDIFAMQDAKETQSLLAASLKRLIEQDAADPDLNFKCERVMNVYANGVNQGICVSLARYATEHYLKTLTEAIDTTHKQYIRKTSYNQRVYEAARDGLLTGIGKQGTLELNSRVTQKEAADAIRRLIRFVQGEKLSQDKKAASRAEILWHKTNLFTMWGSVFSSKYNAKGDITGSRKDKEYELSAEQFVLETANQKLKAELSGIYVIDLDDKQDPSIGLLPYKLDQLYVDSYIVAKYTNEGQAPVSVKTLKNAYLIYYPQKVLKNELPSKSSTKHPIHLSFSFADSPLPVQTQWNELKKGNVHAISSGALVTDKSAISNPRLYNEKRQIVPVMIVPKRPYVEHSLSLDMEFIAGSSSGWAPKRLLNISIAGERTGKPIPIQLR